MTDQITLALQQNGYTRIPSQLPEYTIFYRQAGAQVVVLHLVELKDFMTLTKEQYAHIKEQVLALFLKKGYAGVTVFTLFVTNRIEDARQLCLEDPMSWILDMQSGRLLIYETQVEEYYGLRSILEQLPQQATRQESSSVPEKNFFHAKWKAFCKNMEPITQYATPVNTVFVLINIIVYLGLEIIGDTTDTSFMTAHGALFAPYLRNGHQYYRLFTCMWLHFGFNHLASNMLALYFLGDNVERALGKVRYFFLYIISGLGASAFSLVFSMLVGSNVVSAGASGAIFGMLGALIYIVIRNHGRLQEITTPRLLLMVGYSLFAGITSQGIDNAAHIGGLLTGFLLAVLLYKGNRNVN